MKQLLILALLFIGSQSYGQLKTTEIKDLEPKEEYSNIKVIPLVWNSKRTPNRKFPLAPISRVVRVANSSCAKCE